MCMPFHEATRDDRNGICFAWVYLLEAPKRHHTHKINMQIFVA